MRPQDDRDENLEENKDQNPEEEQVEERVLEHEDESSHQDENDTFINNPHQNDNLDFDQLTKDDSTGHNQEETARPDLENERHELPDEYQQPQRPRPTDVYEEVEIPNLKNQRPVFESNNNQTSRPIFDSQLGFNPKYNNPPKSGKSAKLQLLILALIGLAVIGGTFYLLKNQFQSKTAEPEVVETETVAAPTPTPTPQTLDRSGFSVRVLNGTSKSGLAASVSAKLKELGYQTEKTGNATNSAFTRTVVRVKAGQESLLEQIIRDLTPDFDATSSTVLTTSDAADVEVILGTK